MESLLNLSSVWPCCSASAVGHRVLAAPASCTREKDMGNKSQKEMLVKGKHA